MMDFAKLGGASGETESSIAVFLLLLAMLAELYPGGPSYNIAIAALLVYLHCFHGGDTEGVGASQVRAIEDRGEHDDGSEDEDGSPGGKKKRVKYVGKGGWGMGSFDQVNKRRGSEDDSGSESDEPDATSPQEDDGLTGDSGSPNTKWGAHVGRNSKKPSFQHNPYVRKETKSLDDYGKANVELSPGGAPVGGQGLVDEDAEDIEAGLGVVGGAPMGGDGISDRDEDGYDAHKNEHKGSEHKSEGYGDEADSTTFFTQDDEPPPPNSSSAGSDKADLGVQSPRVDEPNGNGNNNGSPKGGVSSSMMQGDSVNVDDMTGIAERAAAAAASMEGGGDSGHGGGREIDLDMQSDPEEHDDVPLSTTPHNRPFGGSPGRSPMSQSGRLELYGEDGSILPQYHPSAVTWWVLLTLLPFISACGDLGFVLGVEATQISLKDVRADAVYIGAQSMCRVVTVLQLGLKLHLTRAAAFRFNRGRKVWMGVKRNLSLFMPTMFVPEGDDDDLSINVAGRVVALTWIHLICGFLLFALAIVVSNLFSINREFRVSYKSLPLGELMYLKAVSILLTFIALWRRMDTGPCMGQFFCLDCYDYYGGGSRYARKQRKRRQRRGHLAVPVDQILLRDLTVAKGIDQVVSIWMWMSIFEQVGGFAYQKTGGIVIVFQLVVSISIFVDLIGTLLSLTTAWLLFIYLYGHSNSSRDPYTSSESESDEETGSGSSGSGSEDGLVSSGDEYSDESPKKSRRGRGKYSTPPSNSLNRKGRSRDDPRTPLSEQNESSDEEDFETASKRKEQERELRKAARSTEAKNAKSKGKGKGGAKSPSATEFEDLDDGYDDYFFSVGDGDLDGGSDDGGGATPRTARTPRESAMARNGGGGASAKQQQKSAHSARGAATKEVPASMQWADPSYAEEVQTARDSVREAVHDPYQQQYHQQQHSPDRKYDAYQKQQAAPSHEYDEYDMANTYRDYGQSYARPTTPGKNATPSPASNYEFEAAPMTARESVRASAHGTVGGAPGGPSGLSATFTMTPHQFQASWETVGAPPGISQTLNTDVSKVPHVSQVVDHLKSRSFVIIATGNSNGALKVYACARSQPGVGGGTSSLFLLEMVFTEGDPSGGGHPMALTFKCDNPAEMAFFVTRLNLSSLVDTQQGSGAGGGGLTSRAVNYRSGY